mmetsp:Transcript_118090/g.367900  ORF Transcript_118090/g.367900 Transcript_118090/m.367900 type:complete len:211 (+) Transcript_118090:1085-1717(+)
MGAHAGVPLRLVAGAAQGTEPLLLLRPPHGERHPQGAVELLPRRAAVGDGQGVAASFREEARILVGPPVQALLLKVAGGLLLQGQLLAPRQQGFELRTLGRREQLLQGSVQLARERHDDARTPVSVAELEHDGLPLLDRQVLQDRGRQVLLVLPRVARGSRPEEGKTLGDEPVVRELLVLHEHVQFEVVYPQAVLVAELFPRRNAVVREA